MSINSEQVPLTRLEYLRSFLGTKEQDCIPWPYAKKNGYGIVQVMRDSKTVQTTASRQILIWSTGIEKNNLHAAHNCGNPSCVNPNHLRWATPAENCNDRIIHGTNKCPRLSPAKVQEVFLLGSSVPADEIASKFDVSINVVKSIQSRKTHRKITEGIKSRVPVGTKKKTFEQRYCSCGKPLGRRNKSGFCIVCFSRNNPNLKSPEMRALNRKLMLQKNSDPSFIAKRLEALQSRRRAETEPHKLPSPTEGATA